MQLFPYLKKTLLVFIILLSGINAKTQDTIRIVYYNILDYSPISVDKIQYLRQIASYVKPDILVVNEINDDTSAIHILNNILNINGNMNFKKAEFTNGPDTDNMLFYNSDFFSLTFQDTIPTVLRLINRYKLYYNQSFDISGDSVFLDFYAGHLKASSGSTNETRRYEEVKLLKKYIETETSGTNVFFGGDMNFYAPTEPALLLLLDSGAVRFMDPADAIGDWHDNPLFSKVHTQSTRIRQFGGGATGGLDDRFDFIFTTKDLISGDNFVKYIADSYTPIGNDGNHLNDSLTALPLNPDIPDSITYALYGMSDHLPVLMKVALNNYTSLNESVNSVIEYSILPNPSNKDFSIKINCIESTEIIISISNIHGKKIINESISLQKGTNSRKYSIPDKGVYLINLSGKNISVSKKLIIE